MVKASAWWHSYWQLIQQGLPALADLSSFKLPKHRSPWGSGVWLAVTAGIALLIWNWQLLLAVLTGSLIMVLVHQMPDQSWQLPKARLDRVFNPSNRQLLILGSGSIAALTTYLATAIWQDSESHWIASGAILQGLGTLGVLLLLVKQRLGPSGQKPEATFDRLLRDLTEADPLKRLIAVRQTSQLSQQAQLSLAQNQMAAEAFQLMLKQEHERMVRNALLGELKTLAPPERSMGPRSRVPVPVSAGQSPIKRTRLVKLRG